MGGNGAVILTGVGPRADAIHRRPGSARGVPARTPVPEEPPRPDIRRPMDVLLHTRRGCHLCETVEDLLHHHVPLARIVEIDGDGVLEREFGLRVPVLLVDGRCVAEGRIDEATLIAALAAALTGRD